MKIIFLTGNEHKLKEAQEILAEHEVEGKRLDLPELQSLDLDEIIMEKLAAAIPFTMDEKVALMVEDTGFWVGDTGLPGPFIKHFWKTIGREGVVTFAKAFGAEHARAECHVGLLLPDGKPPRFFIGAVDGRIVAPRGESGFGFDPLFIPEGQDRTFAEMSAAEKNAISHRRKALKALSEYLKANI